MTDPSPPARGDTRTAGRAAAAHDAKPLDTAPSPRGEYGRSTYVAPPRQRSALPLGSQSVAGAADQRRRARPGVDHHAADGCASSSSRRQRPRWHLGTPSRRSPTPSAVASKHRKPRYQRRASRARPPSRQRQARRRRRYHQAIASRTDALQLTDATRQTADEPDSASTGDHEGHAGRLRSLSPQRDLRAAPTLRKRAHDRRPSPSQSAIRALGHRSDPTE